MTREEERRETLLGTGSGPQWRLGPGMELTMDVAQARGSDVGVNLCSADTYMAKQFLDDAQVGAVVE